MPQNKIAKVPTLFSIICQKSYHFASLLIVFLSLFTFAHGQKKMTEAEATTLKNQVKALAENSKTITSDFVQFKHMDFLSQDIESKGKMAFKAPESVKWEYTEPFTYSIIFKDKSLYINDNGQKSNIDVGASKLFERLNRLITASIKGDMFDANEFQTSFYKENGVQLVDFVPKDPKIKEFIEVFQLTFKKNGEVEKVKMVEPSGDYTLIVFSNRTTNQTLSDAYFAH